MKPPPVKNEKGCWYYFYISECVLCGDEDIYRERRPPPAPPREKRTEFHQTACDTHFL